MLPKPIVALILALLAGLVLAPAAGAAPTRDFNFRHGEANFRTSAATTPGAYQAGVTARAPCPVSGIPCTWEAHDFEIKPGETNGAFNVTITWGSGDDDWDLYVYRVRSDNTVDESSPVASSAQGGTTEETATLLSPPDSPIEPGKYRIIVDNWAAADPSWEGIVQFEAFIAGNKRPNAVLNAPARAKAGSTVTLDASGSTDPDGKIAKYAWDLDGNGSFETDGGTSATRQVTVKAGRQSYGLRVVDDKGGSDFAVRTIAVGAKAISQSLRGKRKIALSAKKRQRLAKVLRRGLAFTVACPAACTAAARVTYRGKSKTILKKTRRKRERAFPRFRLRPKGSLARSFRRRTPFKVTLRVAVNAKGYAPKTFRRTITIVP